jgi:RimJ/RimL family protein N-acetyltransferase
MFDGEVELGYWISKNHWNRGYASEAGRQMLAIATAELKLTRLIAGHFIDNPASARVLEKLGFVAEPKLVDRHSRGRAGVAPCRMYSLTL